MKKLILTTISFFTFIDIIGQISCNSLGGDVVNNTGSISFSIGQVFYKQIEGVTGFQSQGVQQTIEITTLDLGDDKVNLSLVAFPNPVQTKLLLKVDSYNQEGVVYSIFNIEGVQLDQGEVCSSETIIDFNHLPNATYVMEVKHNLNIIQKFRIIKN